MPLPRLQLFEFNDAPWAPAALREAVVETLSRGLKWGHILQGLSKPFSDFLDRTGATEVLDLCAGAGGPASILAAELRRAGRKPPRFLMTDLHPHPETWELLRAQDPEAIGFVPEPVDATTIPPALAAGRVHMIVNAFHHLPPDVAGAVLRGACKDGKGVFVAEVFERNPAGFFPMVPMLLAAALANPWLAQRRRGAKLLFLPLVILVGPWDGLVSTMRIYTEQELRAMVAPLGDAFEWSYGTYPVPLRGKGFWFAGLRVR
jgi:hypothetical protein